MAVHVERQRRKCKILLPKFNTWKPVLLEQENGVRLPFGNTAGGFSASFFAIVAKWHRRYSVIALPLRYNRVAVTVQWRRDYSVTATPF